MDKLLITIMVLCFTIGMNPMVEAQRASASTSAGNKPNFIVIFVDDLGYGDMGCFGSKKNRTPHVDRMADEGMMMTSFYSTSGVCTPSRGSLMTGSYPLRVGMHQSDRGCYVIVPKDSRGLHPGETTVADMLKEQGYTTACIGKWHLGDQAPFLPRKQGFDYYFGIPFSNDMGSRKDEDKPDGLPPLPLMRNETVIEAPVDQTTITKRYTEEAVKFIRENKDKPFFIYLPHTMPHVPLFSSPAFAGRSEHGAYSDAVEEVDWSTGQLLDTLRELGIDRNTLVIFTSDNGATGRGSNLPFSGGKCSVLEGGMRIPCVVWWPGTVPAGVECGEISSTLDVLPTFANLAGGQVPKDRVIDGKNISELILGAKDAKTPHEAFYYYFMSQLSCVRSGKWKLHLALDPKIKGWMGKEDGVAEAKLYDLEADPGEKIDLLEKHPQVVARLNQLADAARKDIGDYQVKGTGQREPGHFENPQYIRKPEQ